MRKLAEKQYPEELELLSDDQADQLLRMLEDAAEFDALPGFVDDPRGREVVRLWRERRFEADEVRVA